MRMCKCNKIFNGARWVGKDILILLAIVDYIICTLYILSFSRGKPHPFLSGDATSVLPVLTKSYFGPL